MNGLDIKHDLTGMWTCPQCTYQRTLDKQVRCGVCDAIRPGFENSPEAIKAQQEEEELATKSAKKPMLSASNKARLILMLGESLRNTNEFILRRLSVVTDIDSFKIEGTIEQVRHTRDEILKALKKGTSCLVFDRSFTKERQAAWLAIAKRIGVPCDVVTERKELVVETGFANVFGSSQFIDSLLALFSKAPPASKAGTPSTGSSTSNAAKQEAPQATGQPSNAIKLTTSASSATTSTTTTVSTSNQPIPGLKSALPAKMVVDLTADSDDD